MEDLVYKDESFKIIGACMEVHKELGNGFLEAVYQRALANEFKLQNIPFKEQQIFKVSYKGIDLGKIYKADFVCFNKIIVEIKANSLLHPNNIAQTINYLKTSNYKLALLVNFGETSLTWKRFVNTK